MIGREDRVFGRFGDMKVKVLVAQSCLTLCDPWTVPLFMELSRQEYWSGLPLLPPGDLLAHLLNTGLLHCRRFFTV